MRKILSDKKIQLSIIIVATFFVYLNIFQNQLAIDDEVFIKNWPDIRSLSNIPSLLKGEVPQGHQGVYRPLRSVLYAIYYSIWQENKIGWHAHSMVVHLLSTILVYLIVKRLALQTKGTGVNFIPFTASLLFGLHPIHTEAITYMAASMDATGVVFMFASFYFYLNKRSYLSLIFAALAFFTYEMTLTLPLTFILYELTLGKLKSLNLKLKKVLPYFMLLISYIVIRLALIGTFTRAPYPADSLYLTFLTILKVFVKYIYLLFVPLNLANNHVISQGIEAFIYRDYRVAAIAAQKITNPDVLFSLIVLILLISIMIWSFRRHPFITFSVGWFFITLLPVSEIIPQGSMMNERMLYIPSFGFVLFIGYIIFNFQFSILNEMKNKILKSYLELATWCLVFVICLFFGYLTFQRNKDWKDEISLWSKDIKIYPTDNAYAYYQRGNALVKMGRLNEAVMDFSTSNQINPQFVLGLGNIAILLTNNNQIERATQVYQKAIQLNPVFWEGRYNLGNIYLKKGSLKLAAQEYKEVLKIKPDFLPAKQELEVISNEGIQ